MKKIVLKIADLINVKTIVTFSSTALFFILSLRGSIPPDNFMLIFTTIIAFYFGTQYQQVVDGTKK